MCSINKITRIGTNMTKHIDSVKITVDNIHNSIIKIDGTQLANIGPQITNLKNAVKNLSTINTKLNNITEIKIKSNYKSIVETINKINDHLKWLQNKVPLIITTFDGTYYYIIPLGNHNNIILDTNEHEFIFTLNPNYILTLYRHEIFGKYSESKYMLDNMGHPYVIQTGSPFTINKNKYKLFKHDTFRSLGVHKKRNKKGSVREQFITQNNNNYLLYLAIAIIIAFIYKHN